MNKKVIQTFQKDDFITVSNEKYMVYLLSNECGAIINTILGNTDYRCKMKCANWSIHRQQCFVCRVGLLFTVLWEILNRSACIANLRLECK